jgi:hypothetical protein
MKWSPPGAGTVSPATSGSSAAASGGRSGRRIEIRGTVQGVGLRPWIYRLARGEILRCPSCRLPARLASGDEILLEQIEMEVS